jgi:hypothetical protein
VPEAGKMGSRPSEVTDFVVLKNSTFICYYHLLLFPSLPFFVVGGIARVHGLLPPVRNSVLGQEIVNSCRSVLWSRPVHNTRWDQDFFVSLAWRLALGSSRATAHRNGEPLIVSAATVAIIASITTSQSLDLLHNSAD